jgi:hypothetical protein
VTFLKNFLKFREQNPYREAAVNVLKELSCIYVSFLESFFDVKRFFNFPIFGMTENYYQIKNIFS